MRDGSGPAAVILIPQVRNKNLYHHATFPKFRDGKAVRGQESQKTSLSIASQDAFAVRGCEGKGLGFYPPAFKKGGWGFYFMIRIAFTAMNINRTLLYPTIVLILCIFLASAALAKSPERIISLAPSTTEILFAAGLGEKVVAVTTFCDYPEEAKRKPKIGGMSNPSLEAVISLKPDIVLMTTDGNPKEFEQRLRSMNIKTYVFKARTMSQLPDGIRDIGRALNEETSFNALASDIEKTLDNFKARKYGIRKKALFMIWPEPLIVAGPETAINDAINLLGAVNIAEDAGTQYPKYSIEEVVRRSPDIIFVGKGSGMNMQEAAGGLLKRLSYIPAVKNNKVFYVGDGLYRLGPRVIEGIEELENLLNK